MNEQVMNSFQQRTPAISPMCQSVLIIKQGTNPQRKGKTQGKTQGALNKGLNMEKILFLQP